MRALLWALLPIQASTSREIDKISDTTENVCSFGVVQDRIEGLKERIFARFALAHES
jgi:hypothetical protein